MAQAAAESGVAARPIEDIEAYRQKLMGFVYHSGQLMRPLFAQAKKAPKRVIYADGEDERVLRAVQTVIDEKLAQPILIGRPSVIEMRIKKFGLRMTPGVNLEIVDPEDDGRFNETWNAYYQLKGREGVTPAIAKAMIRKHNTLIGAMLLRRGDADALLCGVASKYDNQLKYIDEIIGRKEGQTYAALNVLMLPDQTLFVTDTHVNENPRPRSRQHHHPGRRRDAALWRGAEDRAAVALELRQPPDRVVAQDGRRAPARAGTRARPGSGR